MTELADAYLTTQRRTSSRTLALDTEQLALTVPACPAWTVHDLIAHQAGICSDMAQGRFPTGDVDAWTGAHVDQRRGTPIADVVEEWNANVAAFVEAMSGPLTMAAGNFVADVVSHELDLQGALGRTEHRDEPQTRPALTTFATMLGARLTAAGLPAVELRCDDDPVLAGEGSPGASVDGTRFELLRAISGRRTMDELRALRWDGDPGQVLEHLSPYPLPPRSLGE